MFFYYLPSSNCKKLKMKKCILGLCLCLSVAGWSQLTINITSAYQYTPLADTLFLSGSFNAWVVNSPAYVFTRTGINTFQIVINPPAGTLQFKVTRGSWTFVEGNATGGSIGNRSYTYSGSPSTLNIQIAGWQDLGGTGQSTTATSNVYILDTDFPMPQLNTSRRIWIYLPPDYYTSLKQYPVLYMHDGQNLFDQNTSAFGEWKVDESLNTLFNQGDFGIVVVGIDNGAGTRVNPSYGGGQGAKYVDWIANNLKPYIDKNYRVSAVPKYTGIMGSSMGGLISQYGGVQFPQVFKKVGLLFPSFWFTDTIFQQVHTLKVQPDQKFYFVSGTTEDSSMVPLMVAMKDSVIAAGLSASRTKLLTWADGQHAEWFWSREFPAAYQWLFNDLNTTTGLHAAAAVPLTSLEIFPNPANDVLYLRFSEKLWTLDLYDPQGRLLMSRQFTGEGMISTADLPAGMYVMKGNEADGNACCKKIVVQH
jgi:predicted alpha/beta superfamily hydrolase